MTTPFDSGDDQGSLVPLFTLAPNGDSLTGRNSVVPTDRAVLARSNLFGYDCRLDGDPATRPRPLPTYSNGRSRKTAAVGVVVAMLAMVGAVLATQPGAREMATNLFSSHNAAATTVAPSPTGAVLHAYTSESAAPVPSSVPSATPLPSGSGLPGGASPTPVPAPGTTTPPTPSPTADAPVYVAGDYNGRTVTTCQSGQPGARSCSWQVSVAAGDPLDLQVELVPGDKITITVTNAAGHVVRTQSTTSGSEQVAVAAPPSPAIVTVSISGASAATFTLGIASHSF